MNSRSIPRQIVTPSNFHLLSILSNRYLMVVNRFMMESNSIVKNILENNNARIEQMKWNTNMRHSLEFKKARNTNILNRSRVLIAYRSGLSNRYSLILILTTSGYRIQNQQNEKNNESKAIIAEITSIPPLLISFL